MARHSLSYGRRHMILSGHKLASLAGMELLEEGGSVIDAAIGAAAVMSVVLPSACSLGGDAFMLVHKRDEGVIGLNGSGPCPLKRSIDDFPDGIPIRGPDSATIPALVRAWYELHRRFGRLKWKSLFRRATEHAANGFPLSDDIAAAIASSRPLLEKDPGCAELFLRDGGVKAGELFRQEALARTLDAIAQKGPGAFHEGDMPRRLCDYVGSRGGAWEPEDFAQVKVEWVQPLATAYRGMSVQAMPPNSFGLYLLLQLKLVERAGLDWLRAPDEVRLALLIRAAQQAFVAGRDNVADPAASPQAGNPDLDAVLAKIADEPRGRGRIPNGGGTAIASVADGEGNGCVLVQSVFRAWGAAVLDPETGVLLNDRLSGFNIERGHPNMVAPRKRPAHTLCPVMVLDGRRLRYLAGSPGGPGQTITLTQLLTNLLDRGMTPAEAVEAPRWSVGHSGELILEGSFPDETARKLQAEGLAVTLAQKPVPFFGSAQLIELRETGLLAGSADLRREDCLLAR